MSSTGFLADSRFAPETAGLVSALAALAREEVVVLPFLDAAACDRWLATTETLPYRPAKPELGKAGARVYQDFELCYENLPDDHPLRDLAAALEADILGAAARLDPAPLESGFTFNDIIVQRYAAGSRGITAHRDHRCYRGLVALITLSGRARYVICEDRQGRGARAFSLNRGELLLMVAPGYAGGDRRPFHLVCDVAESRVGVGLRWDTSPARDNA